MTKYIKFLTIIFLTGFLVSCDSLLEDQLDNPNEVTTDKLDANLLMNKVMVGFADFYSSANDPCMEVSRMLGMIGGDTYPRAYQAESFNGVWIDAYQGVIVQADELLTAIEGKGLTTHAGVAKILKAYTFMALVDMFQDVPMDEAAKGTSGNFNPKAEGGQAVYTKAIALLDAAITDLSATPVAGLTRDIYYGGDKTKWITLANTIKLKAYVNIGDKAKIEELLKANIIDTDAEEFTYKYGTASIPNKSRHYLYNRMYDPTAGEAGGYINNMFMLKAYNSKGIEDPRWRYYFYRQVGSIDKALEQDPNSVPCTKSPKPDHYSASTAWCVFDPGFFGRDHGNNDGIPPDGPYMTVVGVYPFGGRVDLNVSDANYWVRSQQGQGANGAGIDPIWMASFTDFLKAEAVLRLGVSGDAKASLLAGVQKSVERVLAFGKAKGQEAPAAVVTPTADYLSEVEGLYDNQADKLNVVMTEFWLAAYGNGLEGYNLYRRTGKPADMQPMRAANPGSFLRSFIYPANFVNLNSSATQKSNTAVNKVFWDKNPDDFVK
jgi:Starch-binding associating with outer membrane/Susd and RagB outer membrane lipoprotein